MRALFEALTASPEKSDKLFFQSLFLETVLNENNKTTTVVSINAFAFVLKKNAMLFFNATVPLLLNNFSINAPAKMQKPSEGENIRRSP